MWANLLIYWIGAEYVTQMMDQSSVLIHMHGIYICWYALMTLSFLIMFLTSAHSPSFLVISKPHIVPLIPGHYFSRTREKAGWLAFPPLLYYPPTHLRLELPLLSVLPRLDQTGRLLWNCTTYLSQGSEYHFHTAAKVIGSNPVVGNLIRSEMHGLACIRREPQPFLLWWKTNEWALP